MGIVNEDRSFFMVKIIASELGYTVKRIGVSNMIETDLLVIENESRDQYHSFVGVNKLEVALEWLRRKV